MNLRLKDEVTKILIEHPGMSISELAKKTKNYYSYTHKLLSEMQRQKLVQIEKVKKGKRTVTIVRLVDDYKHEWVMDVKRFFKSLLNDAEVKTAFMLMYAFILVSMFKPVTYGAREALLAAPSAGVDVIPELSIDFSLIIVIIIPVLLLIWFLRKRKRL